jgi:hypothetical protein
MDHHDLRRAADACFALGGSSALYESSPLQRRLRDLHAAAQHADVQQRRYVGARKLLLDSSVVGHSSMRRRIFQSSVPCR